MLKLNLWHKSFCNYLLWPLSLLYCGLVFIRRKLYEFNILKTTRFSTPVIVVGNITVGGSGKTPLVITIVEFLKRKGWRPGIISRGYGGKANHYPCKVNARSNPREVGDEPLLMVRHTECPTIIDPNRTRGVKTLLGKTNCNVVISDDGLQHLALGRDIEIAVIDGQRRFGSGFCLPAGPLREASSRLKTVDFVVTKGQACGNEYEMNLIPEHFYQLIQVENTKNVDFFYGKKLHAVAAIGNPDQFFSSLSSLGLTITEHPFPDHYFFKPHDFNYGKDAIILMTEKDAVKCVGLVDSRLWCLKTKVQLDKSFFNALLYRMTKLSDNPKSSSNSF